MVLNKKDVFFYPSPALPEAKFEGLHQTCSQCRPLDLCHVLRCTKLQCQTSLSIEIKEKIKTIISFLLNFLTIWISKAIEQTFK